MRLGQFTFLVAGRDQRFEILELRKAIYGEELAYGGETARWDLFDDRAYHLLALSAEQRPVATMRLLGPSARPFEMETSLDLTPFLRPTHPAGEITRFCIAPEYRRITRSLTVHAGLIRLLYDVCRAHGIDDVLICAKPNARKLYEFALYEPLTEPSIAYAPLNGDMHLLMRLHTPTLPKRYIESNHALKIAFESPDVSEST